MNCSSEDSCSDNESCEFLNEFDVPKLLCMARKL